MAKIPTTVYFDAPKGYVYAKPVHAKKGFLARLARVLYNRWRTKWLFNLGWAIVDVDTSTPIGTVQESDDGQLSVFIKL